MKVYKCAVCQQEIDDYGNSLVIIARQNNDYVQGYIAHKGKCDDSLSSTIRTKGLNANSSVGLSELRTLDNIAYYLTTGEDPFLR